MALPADAPDKAQEWAEGEGAKEQERGELFGKVAGQLAPAMAARGHDPGPVLEAMGG